MTARAIKRLTNQTLVRRAIAAVAAAYLHFAYRTSRWDVINAPDALWDTGTPFITGYWHGRLLILPHAWRKGVPVRVMISRHRDGDLITRTTAYFGFNAVRGSTNGEGGASALRELLRSMKAGVCICLCPDGPRGPRMRANEGIVVAARLSGAPVIPVSCSMTRRKMLRTWDRFLIPLPFSRGVVMWGSPITVARDADEAATARARLEIETALIALTAAADRATGHEPIEPAALPAAATLH